MGKDILNKRLTLVDHDALFYANPDAKIINKTSLVSSNLSQEFTDNVFSDMGKDVSFVATCACGELLGNFFLGITCPKCRTIVSTEFSDRLSHTNWVYIPETFSPIINPLIYEMLRKWGEPIRYQPSIIDCILDPNLSYPEDFKPPIEGKGFKYFYENFDSIMAYLLNEYPATSSRKNNHEVSAFINLYRNQIFCRHLPILNSSLHPVSKSGSMKYVDKTSKEILMIITDLTYSAFIKRKGITQEKNVNKSLFEILINYRDYIFNLAKQKLN